VVKPSLARGRLQAGLAAGGALRWAVADITEVVETARARMDLSPVASAALGRTLAGAALLLRLASKVPLRLVLEIRGDGPLGQVVAEADEAGNLRGMVGHRRVEVPPTAEGKLAVGRAVGRGLLRVIREHPGGHYHSQVELVSGEIGEDVAHYLEQSEQTRSAVLVGVLARPAGVAAAGGVIVEVLPGASEAVLTTLERNLGRLPGVSRVLEAGGDGEVLDTLLAGLERQVTEQRPLDYRCRCDRARLLRHLVLLGPEERRDFLLPDGTLEAECLFCGEAYRYRPEELAEPPG
jgi:molecular chaperone Hsp33